jgi:hypothetical protein
VKRIGLIALLLLTGCAIRKPVQKLYCQPNGMSKDGKHCLVWAKTHPPCVHDVYGDCKK